MSKRADGDGGRGAPLRRERELRGWSQAEVASRLGAPSPFHVSRWERGVVRPSPRYRERYCRMFGKTASELGFIAAQPVGSQPVTVCPTCGRPLTGEGQAHAAHEHE